MKNFILFSLVVALLASCNIRTGEQIEADVVADGIVSCKASGGFYGATPSNIYAGSCYANKYGYCSKVCRQMFEDLNDTWGSSQNQADTISSGIIKCMDDCNSKN